MLATFREKNTWEPVGNLEGGLDVLALIAEYEDDDYVSQIESKISVRVCGKKKKDASRNQSISKGGTKNKI